LIIHTNPLYFKPILYNLCLSQLKGKFVINLKQTFSQAYVIITQPISHCLHYCCLVKVPNPNPEKCHFFLVSWCYSIRIK